jgi:hypothetical protein
MLAAVCGCAIAGNSIKVNASADPAAHQRCMRNPFPFIEYFIVVINV